MQYIYSNQSILLLFLFYACFFLFYFPNLSAFYHPVHLHILPLAHLGVLPILMVAIRVVAIRMDQLDNAPKCNAQN